MKRLSYMLAAVSFVAAVILVLLPGRATAEVHWKQLWNGQTMNGWEHVGPGGFVIEDGLLKTEGGMGLLWYTKRKFGMDDAIRVVFKTTSLHSNSGVYIRFPEA